MAFSATRAATEGFRIMGRRPLAVLAWAAIYVAVSLISGVLTVVLFGDAFRQMASLVSAQSVPSAMLAAYGLLVPMYLVAIPVGLLIYTVFISAIYRAVLRPQDRGMAYIRLGATEFRLLGAMIVLFLLSLIVFIGMAMVLALIAGGVGMAVMGGDNGGAAFGGVVLIFVLYLLMLLAFLAFAVKFSFCLPMTFAEGRIRIFGSWNATRGRFWPLFGGYLLSYVMALLIAFVGWGIGFAFLMGLGGNGAGGLIGMLQSVETDYFDMSRLFSPGMIAYTVISALTSTLTYLIILAPPAAAYRDIVGPGAASVADTFN